MNKAREFDRSVLEELKALLGERVSTSAAVREHHGKDESYFPTAAPDAVVFVRTTEEVRDVVDICRRHRVPMIPFGVGTSLEGHILAVAGGVSVERVNALFVEPQMLSMLGAVPLVLLFEVLTINFPNHFSILLGVLFMLIVYVLPDNQSIGVVFAISA